VQRFQPINTLFIENHRVIGSINIFTGMLRVGKIIFLFVFCFASIQGRLLGQSCTTLGQNPYSAFPVCGSLDFAQKTVPECGSRRLPTFCPNDGNVYIDLNPYWYKFTCYTAGTLGLLITPNNLADDYDWQLFDITGHDPMDVYTDSSLVVCYNWSGETGITGTSKSAVGFTRCGSLRNGPFIPLFSEMPKLVEGHEYLLLISHFSGNNQSGYSLSFPTSGPNGGTASIINPVKPAIVKAAGVCDGTQILVKLNRRINCTTIAKDGSDFTISNGRKAVSASGKGCLTGFDSDSILVTVDKILTPGSYTITAQVGTDANTLADNCASGLVVGDNASMVFVPGTVTLMDSISPIKCISDSLELVFSKPMACNSIAADGSDFLITGPSNVIVQSAKGICADGVSTYIHLKLAAPIRVNGTFTITLRNGSDGNPLIDECGFVTPAGSTIKFTTQDITTADIQSTVGTGCKYDSLFLSHNGNGNANNWSWKLDASAYATQQTPVPVISRLFGDHLVQLKVGNGFCTDTSSMIINFPDHTVKAGFIVADTLCPTSQLKFSDNSSANAIGWRWNFGNGNIVTDKDPAPQSYPTYGRTIELTASLTVQNNYNCTDAAYKIITILNSCYLAVPSAFTPNGDGLNDYLHPLNAFKALNMVFRVYNRYGQVIFEATDASKKWDGRYQSIPQAAGTYVWTFNYTDRDTGEQVALKGTTVLIR
jgi:gliding motility-associated-like protein